jgi:hypothetical protein
MLRSRYCILSEFFLAYTKSPGGLTTKPEDHRFKTPPDASERDKMTLAKMDGVIKAGLLDGDRLQAFQTSRDEIAKRIADWKPAKVPALKLPIREDSLLVRLDLVDAKTGELKHLLPEGWRPPERRVGWTIGPDGEPRYQSPEGGWEAFKPKGPR